jgi:8-oxo-dGTP diphosphatase
MKDPGIGVGVFLANIFENKILLGQRKDSGLFGLPGGWLETGEEWNECASRELKEETGLSMEPNSFKHIHTLNCKVMNKNYHIISCVMYNEVTSKELNLIENTEPDKCSGWFWISIADLRTKFDSLFYPLRDFLSKFPELNSVNNLKNMIKISNNNIQDKK